MYTFQLWVKKALSFPSLPLGATGSRAVLRVGAGAGEGFPAPSRPQAGGEKLDLDELGERSLREQGAGPDFPSDPLSVCRWKKELRFTSPRLQPHARGGRPAASPTVAAWGRKSLSGSNREQTGAPR